MKNIFVINGAHPFNHSGGKFNQTLSEKTIEYFKDIKGYNTKLTNVGEKYDLKQEVDKFNWADLIVYHTPIWWFQLPFGFKEYLDRVLTEGRDNGIYKNDGRSKENPNVNYGKGGLMKGKNYILTTTWNAPKTAFTLENEFFEQKGVDEGIMFGFHKMNSFIGMKKLASYHFHDMMKNANVPLELENYTNFLNTIFSKEKKLKLNETLT